MKLCCLLSAPTNVRRVKFSPYTQKTSICVFLMFILKYIAQEEYSPYIQICNHSDHP